MNRNGRGGNEPDLVAGAGDVIFQIADAIAAEIADAGLAARAKRENVGMNFLELGPAGLERANFHYERVNMRIALGGIESINEIMLHGNKFSPDGRKQIHRTLFIDFAADFQQQDGIRRNARRLRRDDDNHHQCNNHQNNYERAALAPGHDYALRKYESGLRDKIASCE